MSRSQILEQIVEGAKVVPQEQSPDRMLELIIHMSVSQIGQEVADVVQTILPQVLKSMP